MFDVTSDAKTGRLKAKLQGIWSMATVDAYVEALEHAARKAGSATRRPTWLIDLADLPVQPREIADRMAPLLEPMRDHWQASVAVVATQALVTLQTRRIVPRPDHRLFASVAEAEAWLDSLV
jgi:hypothetical protein